MADLKPEVPAIEEVEVDTKTLAAIDRGTADAAAGRRYLSKRLGSSSPSGFPNSNHRSRASRLPPRRQKNPSPRGAWPRPSPLGEGTEVRRHCAGNAKKPHAEREIPPMDEWGAKRERGRTLPHIVYRRDWVANLNGIDSADPKKTRPTRRKNPLTRRRMAAALSPWRGN